MNSANMSTSKEHIFAVTLRRHDRNTPWGLSIVGGVDLGAPIVVTKVVPGSPCDKKLIRGDEIKKIENYDGRDISHPDAQNLFQNATTTIKLVVKRNANVKAFGGFNGFPLTSQSSYSNISPRSQAPASLKGSAFTSSDASHHSEYFANNFRDNDNSIEQVRSQPYRTTPLVLPGAKAKHEAPTGSYLRHHPNPMVRASPSHYEFLPHDVAIKQKVADTLLQKIETDEALAGKQIIRQQFNTPIGLYSNKNIVDTIHSTTGINSGVSRSPSFGRPNKSLGPRKPVVYDPAKSETFKALQEEEHYGDGPMHEVTVPAQPKVFTPHKPSQRVHQPVHGHTYDPMSPSSAPPNVQHNVPYVNSMGYSGDQIAQSGSFKRLMNMVLADSDY